MKCEKRIESEVGDGYLIYDQCGGELEYLMSGARVTGPEGDRTIEDAELYKCSSCGDVTVKT